MTPDSSVQLVVGAGPVGLTMANELARHGVRCRIIDRAAERSQTSKALAIFPRTLEVFETMGHGRSLRRCGPSIHGLSLHHRQEQIARDRSHFGRESVSLSRSACRNRKPNDCSASNSASLGIEVERGVELTELTQTSDAVRAVLRHADGREEIGRNTVA